MATNWDLIAVGAEKLRDQEVINALDELADDSASRSKIGRLRTIFAAVLRTQQAGVSDGKIVETLNRFGFDISVRTFQRTVLRLKKEADSQQADLPENTGSGIVSVDDSAIGRELDRQTRATGQQRPQPIVTVAIPLGHPDPVPVAASAAAPSPSPNTQAPSATLPDDWMTGKLTPEQVHLLTREQRRQRREAGVRQYFPSIYDER